MSGALAPQWLQDFTDASIERKRELLDTLLADWLRSVRENRVIVHHPTGLNLLHAALAECAAELCPQ